MIVNIKSKPLWLLWVKDDSSKLPAEFVDKISDMLAVIDSAKSVPEDFAVFMGWRIHPLQGQLRGYWGLSVTGNWRITFGFRDGNAFDVDLWDYH